LSYYSSMIYDRFIFLSRKRGSLSIISFPALHVSYNSSTPAFQAGNGRAALLTCSIPRTRVSPYELSWTGSSYIRIIAWLQRQSVTWTTVFFLFDRVRNLVVDINLGVSYPNRSRRMCHSFLHIKMM